MAVNTLFCSPKYVKENTRISDNFDEKILVIDIHDMMELEILPALGTNLYDKLTADILAGSVTGNYLTLLRDYVMPTLAKYAANMANYSGSIKYNNKDVEREASESGTSVSGSEMQNARDITKNIAEASMGRLIDHLLANSGDYPEYLTNSDSDEVKPSTDSVTVAMHL